jgi:hypothetical protein
MARNAARLLADLKRAQVGVADRAAACASRTPPG